MTNSLTRLRRIGTAAFVCASIGAIACSSTDEGSSPAGRGGSKAGGTGGGGAGGATGGAGGVATGGATGTGATGGTGGATGGTGGATGGTGGATGGTGGATGGTGGATGGTGGATGGASGAGGAAGKGGAAGTGGATGGASGTGGATGGAAGNGGAAGAGGTAGTGGAAGKGGAAGTGGTAGVADAGGAKDSGGTTGDASGARFSFFVTSQASLVALSGNAKGFGGDLRFGEADGLTGADKICTQTAERGMAGNGKTWRAFLSVSKGPGGTQVNAIDRVGTGPWYDRLGRLVAMTKADLLQARPKGADPAIINDLPNENGVPNQFPDGSGMMHDNHATLTGSSAQGTLYSTGLEGTCQDWTNSTATGGKPHVGYTFPRGTTSNWIDIMSEPGCLAGGTITQTGGADPNDPSVGSSGGYGGFYCLALTP